MPADDLVGPFRGPCGICGGLDYDQGVAWVQTVVDGTESGADSGAAMREITLVVTWESTHVVTVNDDTDTPAPNPPGEEAHREAVQGKPRRRRV